MDAVLTGKGISVAYQQNIIIPSMNVEIPRGCVTSVIGPNGCGKSTLLKALSRMLPVRSGQVLLDGGMIARMPCRRGGEADGDSASGAAGPGRTDGSRTGAYGRYPHQKGFGRLRKEDYKAIDRALEMTHMEEFAERDIDALSGGQRQRAWIAMALAQDTQVILLDEPTTYLDMAHQLEVLKLLEKLNKTRGKTIALVIHDLNLAARFSDRMIAMREGKVLHEGTPEEIMTPTVLEEVFSLKACISKDPWTGRPTCVTYEIS
ncbi:ABC transporter ATP-binding protein [Eisenbergiella tayi]|uniref:ABC transporter ATP-binding protein n=1 Tax=Eisenbergiella tayi TaxID=1432052 RepID=UPI0004AD552E|nr:ABC transporter ATP-binding protein [Eisenbergiella tayi]